jgi:hypothetical protein
VLTTTVGQVVRDTNDGSLDFFYVGNAGTNGNTGLLDDDIDARMLLNGDSFPGNQNGGADGSALAGAFMQQVDLALPDGVHMVTISGIVKDNSGLADIPISVTKTVTIVHPGCGNPAP